MRKQLSNFIKIAITIAGLTFVIVTVPLDKIGDELSALHWRWVWASGGFIVAGLLVRAYRWLLLLQGVGVPVSFKRLAKLYFVGNFFNSFLPTGFGGDVVRVLEASQDVPVNVATGTVIVDRMTGLLMLFVMALAALPFRPDDFPDDLLWLVTAVAIIGLVGGGIILEGRLIRRWGRWLPGKLSVTNENQPLAKVLTTIQQCGWPAVLQALGVSILYNLLLLGLWISASLTLDYQIGVGYYFLVIPILSVVLLVPSVGGLGVRETAAPLLFAGAGLLPEQAVTLSFLVFIFQRVFSLLGAPLYIASLGDNKRPRDQMNG